MGAAARAGRPARRIRPEVYAFFFLPFALVVFATHLPWFGLPFYWDELGQFVPAALDLLREGRWIPRSAVPNVHPPGLMAYLAGVWTVTGYSIAATRAAMLLVAATTVFLAFLLAIRLCRGVPGAPAFGAAILLAASPLFFTQAMLAQLDLPATALTLWALLWFLGGRFRSAAVVCTALVLTKETSAVIPAVFGLWLWSAGRRREALWYLLPFAALSGWLVALKVSTGHWFGNTEFTDYNVSYPLHPVRVAVALLRRAYYLLFANFHWIGWLAVLTALRRRKEMFKHEAWHVTAALAVGQTLAVTLLGGATLERYLLPVLPLMYAAMAASFSALASRRWRIAEAAMVVGLGASLFVNPPYPFPFENNLALADFVRVHEAAAAFVEKNFPGRSVTTAWPLSAALRRPDYGYVAKRMRVRAVPEFTVSALDRLDPNTVDVFILYSKEWDSPVNIWRFAQVRALRGRFYGWAPDATAAYLDRKLGLTPVARWQHRGQWAEVFVKR